MKLLLVSNPLEHPAFPGFLRAAAGACPEAAVLCTGDLLNVFPEPGEDLLGSMFHAIFGDRVVVEMERLVGTGFAEADTSWFVEPLREMFLPGGRHARRALALAEERYARLFVELDAALAGRPFYFIAGNMDYPHLARIAAARAPHLTLLEDTVVHLAGAAVGGLGGIPNTAHPFRNVVEISPNEMSEAEYERRLARLRGIDVLVTHISPCESPALARFLAASATRLLVCRAPFDFRRRGDHRGDNAVQRIGDTWVITVRPFEGPQSAAMVLDLSGGLLGPPRVEVIPAIMGGSAAAPA